jgi:hypothetical protein
MGGARRFARVTAELAAWTGLAIAVYALAQLAVYGRVRW